MRNMDYRIAELEKGQQKVEDSGKIGVQPIDEPKSVTIGGDFLYWIPYETGLTPAILAQRNGIGDATYPKEALDLTFKWNPGFRVFGAFDTGHDFWEIYADWLWYRGRGGLSRSTQMVGTDPDTIYLFTTWSAEAGNASANSVWSKYRLKIDQVQLAMRRQFFATRYLALEPYMGIRAARLHTNFQVNYGYNDASSITLASDEISLSQKTKGIGLYSGLDLDWYWNRYFSFYGSTFFSLLWSKYDTKKVEQFRQVAPSDSNDINFTQDFHKLLPCMDLTLGFAIHFPVFDACNINLWAGWEQHFWFNYNQLMQSYDFTFTPTYNTVGGDLSTAGANAGISIEF